MKILSLMIVLLLFTMPCNLLAQETSDAIRAIADAKTDAKTPYGYGTISFLAAVAFGCLGGSAVLVASQVMTPSLPTERLIGKSPEYVALYISTYENEVKSKRLIHSAVGCLGGSVVAGFISAYLYSTYWSQ